MNYWTNVGFPIQFTVSKVLRKRLLSKFINMLNIDVRQFYAYSFDVDHSSPVLYRLLLETINDLADRMIINNVMFGDFKVTSSAVGRHTIPRWVYQYVPLNALVSSY